jgi:hypothetical protein
MRRNGTLDQILFCPVRATRVPRLSSGFGRLSTRPTFSSLSIRLVMLPDEIIAASSAVGVRA